jgi:hypothetical protein
MPDWAPEDAEENIDAPDEWRADAEEEPEYDDSLVIELDDDEGEPEEEDEDD